MPYKRQYAYKKRPYRRTYRKKNIKKSSYIKSTSSKVLSTGGFRDVRPPITIQASKRRPQPKSVSKLFPWMRKPSQLVFKGLWDNHPFVKSARKTPGVGNLLKEFEKTLFRYF